MLVKIPDINPTLDAFAKLYTLHTTESIALKPKDAEFLVSLSDYIYALDKPWKHQFNPEETKRIEKLWNEYAK